MSLNQGRRQNRAYQRSQHQLELIQTKLPRHQVVPRTAADALDRDRRHGWYGKERGDDGSNKGLELTVAFYMRVTESQVRFTRYSNSLDRRKAAQLPLHQLSSPVHPERLPCPDLWHFLATETEPVFALTGLTRPYPKPPYDLVEKSLHKYVTGILLSFDIPDLQVHHQGYDTRMPLQRSSTRASLDPLSTLIFRPWGHICPHASSIFLRLIALLAL